MFLLSLKLLQFLLGILGRWDLTATQRAMQLVLAVCGSKFTKV